MGSDYTKWLRERELEQAALRGLHPPQPNKPTIEGDVIVPVLQGIAISLAGSLAAGTFALLVGFGAIGWARWALSLKVAGAAFVFVLLVCVVVFVLEHRRTVRDPLDLLWEKLKLASNASPRPEQEPQYVITRGYTPAIPATIEHEVKTIFPPVDRHTEALYNFVVKTWPTGKITRRHCATLGFPRGVWERYVGGVRGKEGQESGRGLLDRAGCVTKTANGWEIAASLQDALSITDALSEYAEARAQLVAGRDGLGAGRDITGGTSGVVPTQQGRG